MLFWSLSDSWQTGNKLGYFLFALIRQVNSRDEPTAATKAFATAQELSIERACAL